MKRALGAVFQKKTILAAGMLLIAVFSMAILPPAALAEAKASAKFLDTAYACAWDTTMELYLYCDNPGGAKMQLTLKTVEGVVLVSAETYKTDGYFCIAFYVPPTLPRSTTIQLFVNDGADPADEAALFCDTLDNRGLKSVERDDKLIAFTFDAANAKSRTEEILGILDEFGAHATFFVLGKYVENYPELCADMIARGNELANHSYEHLDMREATAGQAYRSILRTNELISAITGDSRVLYRPPSGYSTQRDRAIARALGGEVILWTEDSRDGFGETAAVIVNRVESTIGSGDIVLFHVYGKGTCAALRILLPYYIEQGYRFVTVSELMLSRPYLIDDTYTQRRAAGARPNARELAELGVCITPVCN